MGTQFHFVLIVKVHFFTERIKKISLYFYLAGYAGMFPWWSERKSLPEYLKEIPKTAAHQVHIQDNCTVPLKLFSFFFSTGTYWLSGLTLFLCGS